MLTNEKRLKRNIFRNEILDRELDYLPATINRDDVREMARMYGPRRSRSIPIRVAAGTLDFIARYSAPFIGMVAGAEYRAAKALYPLIGTESRFGDSLRMFLGESIGTRIEDTSKAFEVAGALIAATPQIVVAALQGALLGIAAYYLVKWSLILGASYRRKMTLVRKVRELLV